MKYLQDLLSRFSPLNEEQQPSAISRGPAVLPKETRASVPQAAPAPVPAAVEQGITPVDPSQIMGFVGEARDFAIPQVDASKYDSENNEERENAFRTELEALKENYGKASESAGKRQMYAEMLAAVGNNIGNIVGGAQAMNTKASVSAPKTAPINVKDLVGQVDSRFNKDYDNLLKQYKDLKDGGITAKERMYADVVNAQLQMAGIKTKENMINSVGNRGMRGVTTLLNEQHKNELSDKQVGELSDMDNTLDEISKITTEAEKFKDILGPNAADYERSKEGRLGKIIPGKVNEDYVKFRSNAKALQGQYQKIISGLTLTEGEREELKSYIPNVSMPHDVFRANAESFQRRVKELRTKKLKSLEKYQGKNTKGYTQPSAPQAPEKKTVERMTKDGKVAIFDAETKQFIKYK